MINLLIKFTFLIFVITALTISDNCRAEDENSEAIRIATEYLMEVKKWKCGEFIADVDKINVIELKGKGSAKKDNIVVIRSLHKDDLHLKTPGGGKSLAIEVDTLKKKVISALHYQ
ncbi:hypothetical protein [Shewanella algicola]|uniref:hypothetical protein n=1 Tax=Shewanella algicola TaxID=640633 RepID=UPI00249593AD|nr:hypothetical protein [Shewanella algicola]